MLENNNWTCRQVIPTKKTKVGLTVVTLWGQVEKFLVTRKKKASTPLDIHKHAGASTVASILFYQQQQQ